MANGSDVLSCGQMMDSLENTLKVQLNEITSEQIDAVVEKVSGSCPVDAIKGTIQIHQLMVPSRAALYHRKLSCYCADTLVSRWSCLRLSFTSQCGSGGQTGSE